MSAPELHALDEALTTWRLYATVRYGLRFYEFSAMQARHSRLCCG